MILLTWSVPWPPGSEKEKLDYRNSLRETRKRLLYGFRLICIIHYINDPIKMLKLMTVSVHSRVGVQRRLCLYKSLSFLLIDTLWKRRIKKKKKTELLKGKYLTNKKKKKKRSLFAVFGHFLNAKCRCSLCFICSWLLFME